MSIESVTLSISSSATLFSFCLLLLFFIKEAASPGHIKCEGIGIFLMVQWFRLQAVNEGSWVGEVRSLMPCGIAKRLKKNKLIKNKCEGTI